MSILIKGVKMPKACVYRENGHLISCPLYDDDGYCGALNTEASHKENGKLSGCPLVPVPPHGRLIDADELYASLKKWLIQNRHSMTEATRVWVRGVLEGIAAAPTIIEAEEGET